MCEQQVKTLSGVKDLLSFLPSSLHGLSCSAVPEITCHLRGDLQRPQIQGDPDAFFMCCDFILVIVPIDFTFSSFIFKLKILNRCFTLALFKIFYCSEKLHFTWRYVSSASVSKPPPLHEYTRIWGTVWNDHVKDVFSGNWTCYACSLQGKEDENRIYSGRILPIVACFLCSPFKHLLKLIKRHFESFIVYVAPRIQKIIFLHKIKWVSLVLKQ